MTKAPADKAKVLIPFHFHSFHSNTKTSHLPPSIFRSFSSSDSRANSTKMAYYDYRRICLFLSFMPVSKFNNSSYTPPFSFRLNKFLASFIHSNKIIPPFFKLAFFILICNFVPSPPFIYDFYAKLATKMGKKYLILTF